MTSRSEEVCRVDVAAGLSDVRAGLDALLEQLGADELRVLSYVAARLVGGVKAYGVLDIATDGRCWRKERDEELADALVYAACESLRRDLKGGL